MQQCQILLAVVFYEDCTSRSETEHLCQQWVAEFSRGVVWILLDILLANDSHESQAELIANYIEDKECDLD